VYNDLNQLTETKLNGIKTWSYQYDQNGNVDTIKDGADRVIKEYEYYKNDWLKSEIYQGHLKNFTYSKNGFLTNLEVVSGTQSFKLDFIPTDLDQLQSIKRNGVQLASYEYNTLDLLGTITRSNGVTTNIGYDDAGHLKSYQNSNSTGQVLSYFNYIGYDGNYNVTELQTNNGTLQYEYDNLNQLIKENKLDGSSLFYKYDPVGNRTKKIELKNGTYTTETFKFNGSNQITEENSGNAIPLTEWEQGTISSTGNEISSTRIRTANFVNVTPNKLYELFNHKNEYELIYAIYDTNYNLIQLNDTWSDSVAFTTPANAAFVKVVLRKFENSVEKDLEPTIYLNVNPFLLPLNETQKISFIYDKNGNLLNDGQKEYQFDIVNQMESTTDASGNQVSFSYDNEGKRISKTTSTGTVKYHYLGEKVIYETDQNDNILVEYTWNPNGYPATMVKNGYTYHYILNGHGDVIGLRDSFGNLVAEYKYDAWGNILSQSGPLGDTNPLRYSGYYFDKETGLYYLLARYYNPKKGVFLSLDPEPGDSDDPLTLNGYTYAVNNPVMYFDPDGNRRAVINIGIKAVVKGGKKVVSGVKIGSKKVVNGVKSILQKGLTNSKKPQDYLKAALSKQGLKKAPDKYKEKWSQDGYNFEVRIHPADPKYGKKGSIYRVARQRQVTDNKGQGSGWEYMDENGNWHHTSTLNPKNHNFNEDAARDTHIQLP
jgi:RHS repeat-associated protein